MKDTRVACVPFFSHCHCTQLNVVGRVLVRKMHSLYSTSSPQPRCHILAESPCALRRAVGRQCVAGKGGAQARAAQVGA